MNDFDSCTWLVYTAIVAMWVLNNYVAPITRVLTDY